MVEFKRNTQFDGSGVLCALGRGRFSRSEGHTYHPDNSCLSDKCGDKHDDPDYLEWIRSCVAIAVGMQGTRCC